MGVQAHMAIDMEFIAPNIYVFHWSGVVRPDDATNMQMQALEHAAANCIPETVQIVDMREIVTIVWDIRAFMDIIKMNKKVKTLFLVQPPSYIRIGAKAVANLLKFVHLETVESYDDALAQAKACSMQEA